MIFDRNWPLSLGQITKRKSNLKLGFVLSTKLPTKTSQSGHFHFLKMFKANLRQDRLAQKIKKVDSLFLVWETLLWGIKSVQNIKNEGRSVAFVMGTFHKGVERLKSRN